MRRIAILIGIAGVMAPAMLHGAAAGAHPAGPRYAAAVLADHPIAYYPLTETTGTTAHDASGHHLDGRIGSRVVRGKPGLIADDATSLEFDGADETTAEHVVRVPGNRIFERARSVSIEAWVYPYDVGIHGKNSGDITIAAYGHDDAADGQHCRYALELDAHSRVLHFPVVVNGTVTDRVRVTGIHSLFSWMAQPFERPSIAAHMLYGEPGSAANPPSARKRYHLVGTYDGATMRFYVDGALNRVLHVRGAIDGYAANRDGMGIGGEFVDENPVFHGRIAEVAIYPAALSADTVLRHYRIGSRIRTTVRAERRAR